METKDKPIDCNTANKENARFDQSSIVKHIQEDKPVTVAEPLNVKGATAKEIFIKVYQQWYGTGSNYHNNDSDLGSHDGMIFQAMQEYATIQRKEILKIAESSLKSRAKVVAEFGNVKMSYVISNGFRKTLV